VDMLLAIVAAWYYEGVTKRAAQIGAGRARLAIQNREFAECAIWAIRTHSCCAPIEIHWTEIAPLWYTMPIPVGGIWRLIARSEMCYHTVIVALRPVAIQMMES